MLAVTQSKIPKHSTIGFDILDRECSNLGCTTILSKCDGRRLKQCGKCARLTRIRSKVIAIKREYRRRRHPS